MKRPLAAVACAVLGFVVGVCVVAVHGYWWGLALGVVTTAATLVALPAGWWSRLAFAIGWVGVLALVTPERPEGDFLVAGDANGTVLLAAGVVVFGAGFVGLVPSRRAARDSGPSGEAP